MDLLSSVFTIYGNVKDIERQFRNIAGKLNYELKKAHHLLQTERAKMVPKFIHENLLQKIHQAQIHLNKIETVLIEDTIPFKEKIKLCFPFNDTKQHIKNTLQELEKAQQDFNSCQTIATQLENNAKRFIDPQKLLKKQQTIISILPKQQINDEDIDEALMGPTIQEDAAIQLTKKHYLLLKIELCAEQRILAAIREVNQEIIVLNKKVQLNFDFSHQTQIQELELFSFGRIYFKPVYSKLKQVYEDIDKISKSGHFVIKVQRKRENIKSINQGKIEQKNNPQHKSGHKPNESQGDQFFSFPCTDQQLTKREIDTIMVERNIGKNVYILNESGCWEKMNQVDRKICNGQQIAPLIPVNKKPLKPQLYFKINFQILQ